jgi:hypothetical protein
MAEQPSGTIKLGDIGAHPERDRPYGALPATRATDDGGAQARAAIERFSTRISEAAAKRKTAGEE